MLGTSGIPCHDGVDDGDVLLQRLLRAPWHDSQSELMVGRPVSEVRDEILGDSMQTDLPYPPVKQAVQLRIPRIVPGGDRIPHLVDDLEQPFFGRRVLVRRRPRRHQRLEHLPRLGDLNGFFEADSSNHRTTVGFDVDQPFGPQFNERGTYGSPTHGVSVSEDNLDEPLPRSKPALEDVDAKSPRRG